MSQRTGIPQNMVAKAKKMISDGLSVEHIAQHYRCPVKTIQSLADSLNKSEVKAKIKDKVVGKIAEKLELVQEDEPEQTAEDALTPPPQ